MTFVCGQHNVPITMTTPVAAAILNARQNWVSSHIYSNISLSMVYFKKEDAYNFKPFFKSIRSHDSTNGIVTRLQVE
jgi:hypothetical protein